jgi:hypothetical protein
MRTMPAPSLTAGGMRFGPALPCRGAAPGAHLVRQQHAARHTCMALLKIRRHTCRAGGSAAPAHAAGRWVRRGRGTAVLGVVAALTGRWWRGKGGAAGAAPARGGACPSAARAARRGPGPRGSSGYRRPPRAGAPSPPAAPAARRRRGAWAGGARPGGRSGHSCLGRESCVRLAQKVQVCPCIPAGIQL